jgi:hypothetical protein
VSRIGPLLCLAVVAAVLAGCGGSASARGTSTTSLPRKLALAWARRADAVARAAAAGDSCSAHRLAVALQADVIQSEGRVPDRFRGVLTRAVDHLAGGIPCSPPPQTVTTEVTVPAQPKKGPPHGPPGHDTHPKHGHGQGGDGG